MYNQSVADIDAPLGQSKTTKLDNDFFAVSDVSIQDIAMQNQIAPRQVRTGNTRGDQQIKGVTTVVDTNNTVRIIMGYKKGGF